MTQAMNRFRYMQETRWTEVAASIPGRTAKACRKRWVNGLNERLKKGSWTSDEDARLREGVAMLMNDWARIAEHVGQRSGDQCSKRWREVLDPVINKTCWTPEEDRLLIHLFQTHGSCWQVISTHFNNRRALQCRNRCCKLLGLHSNQRGKKASSPVHADMSTSTTEVSNSPAATPMAAAPMVDMKLPLDMNWQKPTSTGSPVMYTSGDALSTGFIPQMFDVNGISCPNTQINMDYLDNNEGSQTTHFVDAWNKVQGYSSTERKCPPSSLNLVEMEPSLGSQLSSPIGSTYSQADGPQQISNTGSETSSLDASPTTPFTVPTGSHSNNETDLGQNLFAGTTWDVPDDFLLFNPMVVPAVNLNETFKATSNQPQISGMPILSLSLQDIELGCANNFVM